MALDYIRKTSPSYDSESGVMARPLIDPNIRVHDFSNYKISNVAGEGEVFIAGCRNVEQSALTILGSNSEVFYNMVSNVSIGKFGGSIGDRIAKNFCSIAKEMRHALARGNMGS